MAQMKLQREADAIFQSLTEPAIRRRQAHHLDFDPRFFYEDVQIMMHVRRLP